ncbi:unnamed protein product [Miscanthus lutarioriparius]|uniref:Poly(A) RNA polymerase mitochondrial-like central palm domain-containing protein n=1 Tax=Miscanthus lutarioriparius TaxID=422564 RepID=A0A811PR11_9POAL|nr:unnamed protein product [Miscanthus lutarioriparius]
MVGEEGIIDWAPMLPYPRAQVPDHEVACGRDMVPPVIDRGTGAKGREWAEEVEDSVRRIAFVWEEGGNMRRSRLARKKAGWPIVPISWDSQGKNNGLPIVEPFGSFTMDLFTPKSDLDLSINFNTDTNDQYPRRNKISAFRKLANVLFSHQRQGLCYGVSPFVTARVPVLKVIDQGTGVECDISVENKDGMSRSVIFKFISSIDKRFRILCYLLVFILQMKFWAKTRRPPILPAFSGILKDGTDFASIEKNVSLFEGFGDRNKESIAELFVSLMSKLVSVEGLFEQGLCASNFEGSWISKTWAKGVGNLNNFARSVGMKEMQKICECLRAIVSYLSKFSKGKIAAPKLKALLFKPLNQVNPVTNPRQKTFKRKHANPNKTSTNTIQKNAKKKALEQDKLVNSPGQKDGKKPLDQEKSVSSPLQKDAKTKPLD